VGRIECCFNSWQLKLCCPFASFLRNLLLIANFGEQQQIQFAVVLFFRSKYSRSWLSNKYVTVPSFGRCEHLYLFILTVTAICFLLVAILKWEIIYTAGNAVDRLDSMRAGYQIWLNQPIFGVGIEQFYMFSTEFRTQRQFEAYGSSVVVDKAHNVFIDHLSNGGIFVFLAFIGYVFWVLTIIFKMNKKPMSAMQRNRFTFLCTVWLVWLGQASIGPDNNLLTLLSIFAAGLISHTYYSEKEIAISATKKVHLRSRIVGSSVTSSLLLVSVFAYSNSILSYREAKLVTENKITDVTQIAKVINRSPTPKLTEIVLVHLIKNQKNCPYMYSLIEDFKLLQCNL
jgi:hypothetical protein